MYMAYNRSKKWSALTNNWENIIVYWEKSEQSEAFLEWVYLV